MRITVFLALLFAWGYGATQPAFFPDVQLAFNRNVILPNGDMPRFPGCEDLDGTELDRKACADRELTEWLYNRLQYPEDARRGELQGTALIRFNVSKGGRIRSPRIIQDPGAGCGAEALRLVDLMQREGIRWIPARYEGQALEATVNLPVYFRLGGVNGGQVVFTKKGGQGSEERISHPPAFRGDMARFVKENLRYPTGWDKRCSIHDAAISFLVKADGSVSDIKTDPELPDDFAAETKRLVQLSQGRWIPAQLNNQPIEYRHVWLIPFRSPDADCETVNANYFTGWKYYEMGHYDGARASFRRCVELNPQDVDCLLGLGLSEGHLGNLATACAYFTSARNLGSNTAKEMLLTFCN